MRKFRKEWIYGYAARPRLEAERIVNPVLSLIMAYNKTNAWTSKLSQHWSSCFQVPTYLPIKKFNNKNWVGYGEWEGVRKLESFDRN